MFVAKWRGRREQQRQQRRPVPQAAVSCERGGSINDKDGRGRRPRWPPEEQEADRHGGIGVPLGARPTPMDETAAAHAWAVGKKGAGAVVAVVAGGKAAATTKMGAQQQHQQLSDPLGSEGASTVSSFSSSSSSSSCSSSLACAFPFEEPTEGAASLPLPPPSPMAEEAEMDGDTLPSSSCTCRPAATYRVPAAEAAFVFDCCTQGLTGYLERIVRAATIAALANASKRAITAAAGAAGRIMPCLSPHGFGPSPGPEGSSPPLSPEEKAVAEGVARALFLTPLQEQYGRSALMAACLGGQAGTARAVLGMVGGCKRWRRGMLDARDEIGSTALLLAAGEGHAEVVKLLVGEGADPVLADVEGCVLDLGLVCSSVRWSLLFEIFNTTPRLAPAATHPS